MPNLKYIDISDFSGGWNVLDDPQVLQTNESPDLLNVDITGKGKVVCRYGYDEVLQLTGGSSNAGAIQGMFPFYRATPSAWKRLMIVWDNKYYYATDGGGAYSSTSIRSPYHASLQPTDQVKGVVFNNLAITGTGNSLVTPKKWDGTTFANLGGSPPAQALYWGIFQSRLFASQKDAQTSTIYYSDTDDPEMGWSSFLNFDLNDGQRMSGHVGHSDFLQVMKEDSIHGVGFSFDSSYNITVPNKQPIVSRAGGCVAPFTTQVAYNNIYFLSKNGFQSYGANPQGEDRRMVAALSWKIAPIVNGINLSDRDRLCSAFWNNKYYAACSLSSGTVNDTVLVYNEIYNSWTRYNNWPVAEMCTFKDEYNKDRLVFGSNTEGKIYRNNFAFNDAGGGYTRRYRSRTFRFGERTEWRQFMIEGSKQKIEPIYVIVNIDGLEYTYEITDDNLMVDGVGSVIGDGYVGSEYVGGVYTAELTPLYRFRKIVELPATIRQGYEFFFTITNEAANGGWKMDRFVIGYEGRSNWPPYPNAL